MLKINIICIGKIKEKYFSDAIAEYTKRLGAFCKFTIVELAEEKIRDNIPNQSQISEVLLAEGRSILKKIQEHSQKNQPVGLRRRSLHRGQADLERGAFKDARQSRALG